MTNQDAIWCTNEQCSCKTACWRWIGFFDGDEIDPQMVRHYNGGEDCNERIKRDE